MEKRSREKFSWLIVLPLIIAGILIVSSVVYHTVHDVRAVQNTQQRNIQFQGVKFKVVYPEKLQFVNEDELGQPVVISAFNRDGSPNPENFIVTVSPGEYLVLKNAEGQPVGNIFEIVSGSLENGAVKFYVAPIKKGNSFPEHFVLSIGFINQDIAKGDIKSTINISIESSKPTWGKVLLAYLFDDTAWIISALGVIISGIIAFLKFRSEQNNRQQMEDEKQQEKEAKEKRLKHRQEIRNIEELLQEDGVPENAIKVLQQFKHVMQQTDEDEWGDMELAALEAVRRKLSDKQLDILRLVDEAYREDEGEALGLLALLKDVLNSSREDK